MKKQNPPRIETETPKNGKKQSLCHSSTKHLRPEEATLCALNDLLVDGLRGVIHDHGAGLVVYFCVDARVADEVDDPFFAFVLREAEAGGEVAVCSVSMAVSSLVGNRPWNVKF